MDLVALFHHTTYDSIVHSRAFGNCVFTKSSQIRTINPSKFFNLTSLLFQKPSSWKQRNTTGAYGTSRTRRNYSPMANLNRKAIKRATLPVDTRDRTRVGNLACIRGRTDSAWRQGGRCGLTGGLTRRQGRHGPSDAHTAPTYPIFGRVLPRGLRVLREPAAPGIPRHHRGPAGPRLMTYRAPTIQRRAL